MQLIALSSGTHAGATQPRLMNSLSTPLFGSNGLSLPAVAPSTSSAGSSETSCSSVVADGPAPEMG